jgi:uncharacterized protein YcaQ
VSTKVRLLGLDEGRRIAVRAQAAKRRWGYFAHALHHDVRFTRAIAAAVEADLDALASWLNLDNVRRDGRGPVLR